MNKMHLKIFYKLLQIATMPDDDAYIRRGNHKEKNKKKRRERKKKENRKCQQEISLYNFLPQI